MRAVVFWALLLCCYPAMGDYLKQYNTSNGLISNNVYHSLLDSKGYIWFFTDKGISKFDGQNFKNISVFDGLNDPNIFNGYEDKTGRIWLFTESGNPCFVRNDSVFNQTNDTLLNKMPVIRFMQQIAETADGSLYIAYKAGQVIKVTNNDFAWVIKNSNYANYTHAASLLHDTLLLHKAFSKIYVRNNKIVAETKIAENYTFQNTGTATTADGAGLHLYRNEALVWKDEDRALVEKYSLGLYYDLKNKIFSWGPEGLAITDTGTHHKHYLLPEVKITGISTDIYGSYWLTTNGSGVYYLNKNLEQINPLTVIENYKVYIALNGKLFFKNKNSLYYAANNKLEPINITKIPNDNFEPQYLADDCLFYKCNGVSAWLNRKTNKIHQLKSNIKYIYRIKKDSFILFCIDGIHTVNTGIANIKLHSIKQNLDRQNDLIKKACFDSVNKILYYTNYLDYGTKSTLYKFDLATRVTTPLDSFDKYLDIESVHYIDNHIVLLTNSKNIYLYNSKAAYARTVTALPFLCVAIACSQNSYLLTTNKGYYINDAANFAAIATGKQGSYRRLEYPVNPADLLFLHPVDDQIICNLNGKYYSFNDSLLNIEYIKPRFFADSFIINGLKITGNNYAVHNKNNSYLSISLRSLKFNNVQCRYEYRIIHDDTGQWQTSASGRIDVLLQQFGNFIVEMHAVTENNLVADSQYLTLLIFPPFYYSLPFYLLLLAAGIIITIITIRAYNSRKKKKFENELNYLQLEHKAINSLLNPHFVFNAINNIQCLVNENEPDAANNYLVILSKLIRQNIENLQFSYISIAKELSLIRNYILLQNLRYDNKINLIINDCIPDSKKYSVPPLLIHTFVENSVVHGLKKGVIDFTITIDLKTENDYLYILVTDNGVGLRPKKHDSALADKTSLGIDFMRKRLSRLSAFYKVTFSLDISNLSGPGKRGTQVSIVLYAKLGNADKNSTA